MMCMNNMPGRRFCQYCGNQIPQDAEFCPHCGMRLQPPQTPPQAPVPPVRSGLRGRIAEHRGKIRWGIFTTSLILFISGLYFGSITPLSRGEASTIVEEVQSAVTPTTQGIAFHNIPIALYFSIPVFGTALMVFASYSTGVILSALATTQLGVNAPQILSNLLTYPFFWLELIAYCLAATQGNMLLLGYLTKCGEEEVRNLIKYLGICVLLLAVSALMEANLLTQ